ncbi:unnamed protein product, partial [Musa acuminata subsp. burmannicoides]
QHEPRTTKKAGRPTHKVWRRVSRFRGARRPGHRPRGRGHDACLREQGPGGDPQGWPRLRHGVRCHAQQAAWPHRPHNQFSPTPANQGVSVTQTEIPGCTGQRLVTEFVAGQAVGQYVVNAGAGDGRAAGGGQGEERGQGLGGLSTWTDKMTIGEALEAAARAAGDKPVEMSDAAAIEAAESAATGLNTVLRGGMAAAAQSAAILNARVSRDEDKTKLRDVLQEASMRLPHDREATRGDAERVVRAEMRNNPELRRYPGGVADSIAAAARFNQEP